MIRKAIILLIVLAAGFGIKAWCDTMMAPKVKRVTLELTEFPSNVPPITIAMIADVHIAGPDMPPSRFREIATQVNALQPDIIMIAGDLVSEKRSATHIYPPAEVVAPFSELAAPLGVVLVPGNHDHWYGWPELQSELQKQTDIRILQNEAVQIGPLAIGGIDDDFSGRADVPTVLAQLEMTSGPRIVLSHSPDVFPQLPSDIALTMSGHTHCGQIAWPWGGSPATMSRFGQRYSCGLIEEDGKTLITSAGIGTSLLPIRLFTQPDIWLIQIAPKFGYSAQRIDPMLRAPATTVALLQSHETRMH